jgi:hypothetical protein
MGEKNTGHLWRLARAEASATTKGFIVKQISILGGIRDGELITVADDVPDAVWLIESPGGRIDLVPTQPGSGTLLFNQQAYRIRRRGDGRLFAVHPGLRLRVAGGEADESESK